MGEWWGRQRRKGKGGWEREGRMGEGREDGKGKGGWERERRMGEGKEDGKDCRVNLSTKMHNWKQMRRMNSLYVQIRWGNCMERQVVRLVLPWPG